MSMDRAPKGFIMLPEPLAHKLAKCIATFGVAVAAPNGEQYFHEAEAWMRDKDIQLWVNRMVKAAMEQEKNRPLIVTDVFDRTK